MQIHRMYINKTQI